MKETDLAQKFVDYLSDYDLYFEFPSISGIVDIVAISKPSIMSYEVKTTFNFKVIEQALSHIYYFHYSYVCVPYSKHSSFQEKICRDYGIGVLVYRKDGWWDNEYVKQVVPPKFNRNAIIKYHRFHEYHKQSIPGTATGERMTPFKITVENIERFVTRHPGCSMKQMITEISHHYHSDKAATNNIYQWIRSGVINSVYLKDRKLYLSINNPETF